MIKEKSFIKPSLYNTQEYYLTGYLDRAEGNV